MSEQPDPNEQTSLRAIEARLHNSLTELERFALVDTAVKIAERVAELKALRAEITTLREQRDEALSAARLATNSWACYSTRQQEHNEIGSLHETLDRIESNLPQRPSKAQQDVIELPDKHPLRIRAEAAEARLAAHAEALQQLEATMFAFLHLMIAPNIRNEIQQWLKQLQAIRTLVEGT